MVDAGRVHAASHRRRHRQADLHPVGGASGRDGDKFARRGIVARPGPVLGMPLIETGYLGGGHFVRAGGMLRAMSI